MAIGDKTVYHANVSSTNDVASELINKGSAIDGMVISAGFQSKGKGQRNNKWHSDPFMNLIMSVILIPGGILPEQQFYISKIVSLAIIDTLQSFSDHFSIKWPNDIYYRGDKIAGILIEHTIVGNKITSSIAGIGLNINQKDFPDDIPNPISLMQISKQKHNVQVILNEVCGSLQIRYSDLKNGKFSDIDKSYERLLYLKDIESLFMTKDGPMQGVITGVNNIGQLLIRSSEGLEKVFSFKEIEFPIIATNL